MSDPIDEDRAETRTDSATREAGIRPNASALEGASVGGADRRLLLAALAVSLVAHVGALWAPFFWDDHVLVPRAIADLTSEGWHAFAGAAFANASQTFYRPVAMMSLAFDGTVWGAWPAGFHLTNVLLHLGSVSLVFALARRFGAEPRAAAVGAALFGTLPRLTETVTWVSGRTDGIAVALVLLALWLHTWPRAQVRARVAAAVLLFLGLLAKEVAFAGIVAVAMIEVAEWRRGASGRKTLERCAPLLGSVVLYSFMRLGAETQARVPGAEYWSGRVLLAYQALGTYLRMLLDPLHPTLRIGFHGVGATSDLILGGVAAGMLLTAPIVLWRRRASAGAWAAYSLVAFGLLPILHLIPISNVSVASDRYLYLPAAGLALMFGVAIARLGKRARTGLLVAGIGAVVVFVPVTVSRVGLWQDPVALWQADRAHASPLDFHPMLGLAEEHARRGDFDLALPLYDEAYGLAPFPFIWQRIANAHRGLGRDADALTAYEQLIAHQPEVASNFFELSLFHLERLEFAEAQQHMERAAALDPSDRAAEHLLWIAQMRRDWEALPPLQNDGRVEAGPIVARRARIYSSIELDERASEAWLAVVDAADVSSEDLEFAALYFADRGEADAAQRAIRLYLAAGGDPQRAAAIARRLMQGSATASMQSRPAADARRSG